MRLKPRAPGMANPLPSPLPSGVSMADSPTVGGWMRPLRSPVMGDLRVMDLYPCRDNTSSRPEFGSKFSKGLKNVL